MGKEWVDTENEALGAIMMEPLVGIEYIDES